MYRRLIIAGLVFLVLALACVGVVFSARRRLLATL
jgi:hypothetical protein